MEHLFDITVEVNCTTATLMGDECSYHYPSRWLVLSRISLRIDKYSDAIIVSIIFTIHSVEKSSGLCIVKWTSQPLNKSCGFYLEV